MVRHHTQQTRSVVRLLFMESFLVACASRLLLVIQARISWMYYLSLIQIQIERYGCDLIENQMCQEILFSVNCELRLFGKKPA